MMRRNVRVEGRMEGENGREGGSSGRETRLTVTEGLSSKVRHIELICLFGV
jgi:hypothetical protein